MQRETALAVSFGIRDKRSGFDAGFYHYAENNIWWGMFPRLTQAGFGNACSCRLHGESSLVPGTLNLALHVGDDADLVLQNRRLFAQALGLDASKFTTCEQVHGSNVAVVDEALVGTGATALADTIKDTDALVTNLANVPLLLLFCRLACRCFSPTSAKACALWRTQAGVVR